MSALDPMPMVSVRVDVVEKGAPSRPGWVRCALDENIRFNAEGLKSYCFTCWDPIVYDLLVLAAAVEFCDRVRKRSVVSWGRLIELNIPVHDPDRWSAGEVSDALIQALNFVTGDTWVIGFKRRKYPEAQPLQRFFNLPDGNRVIIPFSDGLDSRAVAGLLAEEIGDDLIRVRVGSKTSDQPKWLGRKRPFASVPYSVSGGKLKFREASARSRGFKFTVISGIAAYLVGTDQIVMPESGQGALGPSLLPVGQIYQDFRNHPLFTDRMESFIAALLRHEVRYHFPRLWFTKGETLQRFVERVEDSTVWSKTWSCWQQNRHVSVSRQKRQCGICAACMLRRLSVFSANLVEPKERYVWEDLSASTFDGGAAAQFDRNKITRSMREYAIAGTLHLDHMAGLRNSSVHTQLLKRNAVQLADSLEISFSESSEKLDRLLEKHEMEWKAFVKSLGQDSFVAKRKIAEGRRQ